MTVYDLSVPIVDGTDWYGDPACEPAAVRQIGSLEGGGWRSAALSLMVLNGTTYLETAAHLRADAPTLDRVPAEKLITRAAVVTLECEGQELLAPPDDLPGFVHGVDSILLRCGWDSHLNEPDYYHASPYFAQALQEWLLRHQPAILGGDMLSFDHPADERMPFLREFFAHGGMILCPLIGLAQLPERVTLCAAPLRLVGSSAAPCRALAW